MLASPSITIDIIDTESKFWILNHKMNCGYLFLIYYVIDKQCIIITAEIPKEISFICWTKSKRLKTTTIKSSGSSWTSVWKCMIWETDYERKCTSAALSWKFVHSFLFVKLWCKNSWKTEWTFTAHCNWAKPRHLSGTIPNLNQKH